MTTYHFDLFIRGAGDADERFVPIKANTMADAQLMITSTLRHHIISRCIRRNADGTIWVSEGEVLDVRLNKRSQNLS
jgi:hypothetical protein